MVYWLKCYCLLRAAILFAHIRNTLQMILKGSTQFMQGSHNSHLRMLYFNLSLEAMLCDKQQNILFVILLPIEQRSDAAVQI